MSGRGSAGEAMSGGIAVRAADLSDAEIIGELLTALGYPASEAEVVARLRRFQEVSSAGVFVAELNTRWPRLPAIRSSSCWSVLSRSAG